MVGAAASTAKGSKVTVKDMEQSIDIATGEGGDAEFFRSQQEQQADGPPGEEGDEMAAIEERDDDDLDRASGDEESPKKVDGEADEEGKENQGDDDDAKLQIEVSILDLDKDGSVNLDKDSDEDGRGTKLLPENSGDIADIVASETNFFSKTITESVPVLGDGRDEDDENEDKSQQEQ